MKDRLAAIEDRIVRACARAGRSREGVTLIAVSKTFPAAAIEEAYTLGLREFGESYVQEFENKRPVIVNAREARYHLIGHLQSNKARKAAELFQTIQTVDSVKLARKLADTGGALRVMIEVKLSNEESKHGAAPEELGAIVEAVRASPSLTLEGLMTIPPYSSDPETARPYFSKLRELAARYSLESLSMGMSGDFEVAIEEGATHIRVGTALFGERVYS
ncbi:MAG: YggS family pyridoxal phosphate-dependent enzyme [Bryobacteraceae bacterium]|nr:YggS family pyridoxal phosphate-dependent enzyme [Bryobacteraceae bacterium]